MRNKTHYLHYLFLFAIFSLTSAAFTFVQWQFFQMQHAVGRVFIKAVSVIFPYRPPFFSAEKIASVNVVFMCFLQSFSIYHIIQ